MRLAPTLLVLALLAGLVGAYARVGWTRMEESCAELSTGDIAYSWSWEPLGFTCTYDDSTSVTKLWF